MREPRSGHPPFATFDVEHVAKADGRKVHYYSWPASPEGEPEPGTTRPAEASRPATSPAADTTPDAQPADRV